MPDDETVLIPDSIRLVLIRLAECRGQTLIPLDCLTVLDDVILILVRCIDAKCAVLLAQVIVIRCADGVGAAFGDLLRLDPLELDLRPHVERCLQVAAAVRILDTVAAAHQAQVVDLIAAPLAVRGVCGIVEIGQPQIVTKLVADDRCTVKVRAVAQLCNTDIVGDLHAVKLRHFGILQLTVGNEILQRRSVRPEILLAVNRLVVLVLQLGRLAARDLEAECKLRFLDRTVAILVKGGKIHIAVRLLERLGKRREQRLGVLDGIRSLLLLVAAVMVDQICPVCVIGAERYMDNAVVCLVGSVRVAARAVCRGLRSRYIGELTVGLIVEILRYGLGILEEHLRNVLVVAVRHIGKADRYDQQRDRVFSSRCGGGGGIHRSCNGARCIQQTNDRAEDFVLDIHKRSLLSEITVIIPQVLLLVNENDYYLWYRTHIFVSIYNYNRKKLLKKHKNSNRAEGERQQSMSGHQMSVISVENPGFDLLSP